MGGHGVTATQRSASPGPRWTVLTAAALLVGALVVVSLLVGSGNFTPAEVWAALNNQPGTPETTVVVIRDFRAARTVVAILVGAALAAAGVMMQTTARNPLADPGLLGVNAGAYLALVLGVLWFGLGAGPGQMVLAVVGAGTATLVVHVIASRGLGGGTPAKIVLTGVALTALLTGIGTAISLLNAPIFDKIRHWNAGSLQGVSWPQMWAVTPMILVGLLVAVLLLPGLNALLLGEDSARSLGVATTRIRVLAAAATALLAAGATAAAGPVSFVGLMVPHAMRSLVGPDLRWLLPASLLAGPVLVLTADIVGRIAVPGELPMGVVTAFLGAPTLIYLVRGRPSRPKVLTS